MNALFIIGKEICRVRINDCWLKTNCFDYRQYLRYPGRLPFWRKMYDIRIVPLTLVWGQEQYLDGVDMQPTEFYERLATDPADSKKTSRPSQFLSLLKLQRRWI